jgi:hypothetical protein
MLADRQYGNVERFGHRGSPLGTARALSLPVRVREPHAMGKRALSVRMAEVRKYLVTV